MDNNGLLDLTNLFKEATLLNNKIAKIDEFINSVNTNTNIADNFSSLNSVFTETGTQPMDVLLIDLVKAFEDYKVHLQDEFERL